MHLASEGNKGHLAVVAVLRRDDLGGLLPGARRTRCVVELREAVLLQLAVHGDEVGSEGDAESAGLFHLPHGLALILALVVLALDSHLKTFESCLGIHVLPCAVRAPSQADWRCLAVHGICETDRQCYGANSEQKLPR